MKYLIKRCCIACFFIPLSLPAQKNIRLTSPDGRILFSFSVKNRSAFYSVMFKDKPIINASPLTLEFDNGLFGNNIKIGKPIFREADEDYELIVGKTKKVHDHFKEVTIPLEEISLSTKK